MIGIVQQNYYLNKPNKNFYKKSAFVW